MRYFTGSYTNKLDVKGKVPIPSKFRLVFGDIDKVYLTRGLDGKYIRMYPPEKYEQMVTNILERPESETTILRRDFLGTAHEVSIDPVGRIQIPQSLRIYADIDNCELDFVGVLGWVEIWKQDHRAEIKQDEDPQTLLKLLDTVRKPDVVE